MGILVFILVLIVLIVVHELGHFFAAKISRMRVDEFGLGYAPKAATLFKLGETEYTLNWLPFGGFVRIHGEDMEAVDNEPERAFYNRPKLLQIFVLIAGVTMNVLLAWFLLAIVFATGEPRGLAPNEVDRAENVQLTIGQVLPGTPAENVGIMPGDVVVRGVSEDGEFSGYAIEEFTNFIAEAESLELTIARDGGTETFELAPSVVGERPVIGVSLVQVGELKMGFFEIIRESFITTMVLLKNVAVAIVLFLMNALTLQADFSQVAGPVGIASVVADASHQGIAPLFTLAAIISLNLAVINMIPIPALDGGRILFVLIEMVTRREIPVKAAQVVNTIGFLALLLLMVLVTVSDVMRLVG